MGIPAGDGPFPAVVLAHGGGWIVGEPASIQPLADFLTDNGFLTVNASYQLALQAPGFPAAIEDIACAVRYAASHPLGDGTVVVIGHSAGAHIGAVVALTGASYSGSCELVGGGIPDGFIGLAGPYDVLRVGAIMTPFFGNPIEDSPDDWEAGNPTHLAANNPALRALLIHGAIDQVVPPDFSQNFYQNLVDGGVAAELVILESVDHAGVRSPSIVGETILEWIEP
ncbi:MAG: alpha/beta hydrolase [Acidimicrobiia bacterium]|nr:alpha/beta hydrolase [Acidimicrobiia bacterium]